MEENIVCCFVIIALMQIVAASPFTDSYNSHFLRGDTISVDTSQTFGNISATPLNSTSYVVNYLDAFPLSVNFTSLLAIQSMDISHSAGRIQFSGKIASSNGSQFIVSLDSNLTSFIK